jgi:hypothetical protein
MERCLHQLRALGSLLPPLGEHHRQGNSWEAASGVGRLGSLAGRPPTGPTRQWPLHTASSCQVHYRGDTYFGRIPYFIVIS